MLRLLALALFALGARAEELGKALEQDISKIGSQVASALHTLPPAPAPPAPPPSPVPVQPAQPAQPVQTVQLPLQQVQVPMQVPMQLPVQAVQPMQTVQLPIAPVVSGKTVVDDEVIASQRGFSIAWRDNFNKRNVQYCSNAYLEEASLHVSLGPAGPRLKELLGLSDPTVLHGRGAIFRFWNGTLTVGLDDLKAYEEKGKFASTSFAVDENTVVIAGNFSFGTKASGLILSETWVRTAAGAEWKLRSHMLAIQELTGALGGPVQASSPIATGRAALQKAGQLADRGVQEVRSGTSAPMLFLIVLATCGVTGVLLRRTRRRREAAIAGFEAMLG